MFGRRKVREEPIHSFTHENGFLSNFHPAPVTLDDEIYPTVEHAYQAAKTLDRAERIQIRYAPNPAIAKRLGKRVRIRPDWDQVKVDMMRSLLEQKFKNPELRHLLLMTKDAELVEGNWWGDTFWGVCDGKGANMLGKLLMNIRALIRTTK